MESKKADLMEAESRMVIPRSWGEWWWWGVDHGYSVTVR
jgi:hypothetical protein